MFDSQKPALAVALLTSALFASGWPTLAGAFYLHRVAPANNKTWQEECGACHFAYQPGLLPTASWDKLLSAQALHDHFGEEADVEPDALKEIRSYALAHASNKYAKDANAPLRVTEEPYIEHKHHSIPAKMIKGNKDVRWLGNCDACHTKAQKGVYDAKTVLIPNYRDYWIAR